MPTKPTISLIIPAYNEEEYIKSCLEYAIKNSAGRLLEIIVVDNQSTDRTAAVAGAYPGVTVVREEQQGPNAARQRGYLESHGDILAFIDADTRMPIGWVERISDQFTKHPDLALLSGPYLYYDIPFWQQRLANFYELATWTMALVIGYAAIFGNLAVRRSVLEQIGGIDASIKFYGDDTDLARKAHKFGQVKFSMWFFIYTSGRRFAGQGLAKTGWLYAINYFSEILLHRPITKGYGKVIR